MTTKKFDSGRSMVEMLGTLAIIGVLSVGAIAGYSYGMDKYRTNQTMYDITLRAVDLMTQASQGRATLSLAEWDKETTIYDFANPAYVEGENLIAFDVGVSKKIPQSVCQMVFDGLSNTAVQIDINDSVATSQDNCGNDNTMTFYFAGGGNGTGGETGEQCGDAVCGICQKCDASTETCVTVGDYEAKCTTDDNKTGWCVGETCQAENCNCDENQYCADTNTYGACSPNPTTTCKDANFDTVDIASTTYYISKDHMSWWDAVSACKALGNKQLLSVYDFVSDWDGTSFGSAFTYSTPTSLANKLNTELNGEQNNVWLWTNTNGQECAHMRFGFQYNNIDSTSNGSSIYAQAFCK